MYTHNSDLRSQDISGPYHDACPSIAKHFALGKPFVTYPLWQKYCSVESKSNVVCSGNALWRAWSMVGGAKQ